jgi:hypothetical protein
MNLTLPIHQHHFLDPITHSAVTDGVQPGGIGGDHSPDGRRAMAAWDHRQEQPILAKGSIEQVQGNAGINHHFFGLNFTRTDLP